MKPGVVVGARRPLEAVFPACGIFVIESHHSDDFRMDWTVHDFAKLLHVLDGRGRLRTPGGGYALEAGRMAVVPAGQKHRIADETPLSLHVLCLRRGILPPGEVPSACHSAAHPALGALGQRIFREMLYEQTTRQPGWESSLTGLALTLWSGWVRWRAARLGAAFLPASESSHRRVQAYIEELRREFHRREPLAGAARRCGLGVRRFTQIFRAITGSSWLEFVRNLRIAHARRLLEDTPRSIASICFECGFEDLSNFYRAFRRAERTSPQRWRARRGL